MKWITRMSHPWSRTALEETDTEPVKARVTVYGTVVFGPVDDDLEALRDFNRRVQAAIDKHEDDAGPNLYVEYQERHDDE